MTPGPSLPGRPPPPPPLPTPAGVWATVTFFVASGLLEIAMAFWEVRPLAFWPLWDACVRGVMHFLLAAGLWHRIALCRSVAMVYCLAAVITYVFVLGMALAQAPVRFPPSVVVQSLLQIPSCSLLFPYLRSPRASQLFPRALFH